MKEKKIVKINLTDLEKEKLAQKEMLKISGNGWPCICWDNGGEKEKSKGTWVE